jgi:hypothetical protein
MRSIKTRTRRSYSHCLDNDMPLPTAAFLTNSSCPSGLRPSPSVVGAIPSTSSYLPARGERAKRSGRAGENPAAHLLVLAFPRH